MQINVSVSMQISKLHTPTPSLACCMRPAHEDEFFYYVGICLKVEVASWGFKAFRYMLY
jgi:hypothetical protein